MRSKVKTRRVGDEIWLEQDVDIAVGVKYPRLYRWSKTGGIAILLILATWAILVVTRSGSQNNTIRTSTILQEWNQDPMRNVVSAAFSPDSKRVAYAFNNDGARDLWTQNSDGTRKQITTGKNCRTPVWSPDIQKLGYLSLEKGIRNLYVYDDHTGQSTLIMPIEGHLVWLRRWSEDGRTIYLERDFNLYALDINTNQISQITSFDQKHRFTPLLPSPAADKLAYMVENDVDTQIYISNLDGSYSKPVTTQIGIKNSLSWGADNKSLIYTIRQGSGTVLYRNDGNSESEIGRYDQEASLVDSASISGTYLVHLVTDEFDVWRSDLLGHESLVRSKGKNPFWPVISPDGSVLAHYAASESDVFKSKIATITDPAKPLLTDASLPDFSADGKTLAYIKQSNQQWNLFAADQNGQNEVKVSSSGLWFGGLFLNPFTLSFNRIYSWANKSSQLAYSASANGIDNMFVNTPTGENEKRITDNTSRDVKLLSPLWSPDDLRIAAVQSQKNGSQTTWKLCFYDPDGLTQSCPYESPEVIRLLTWNENGGLVFATDKGRSSPVSQPGTVSLLVLRPDFSVTNIGELTNTYLITLESSPDGKQVGYVQEDGGISNIQSIDLDRRRTARLTDNRDPRVYFSTIVWDKDSRNILFTRNRTWNTLSKIQTKEK